MSTFDGMEKVEGGGIWDFEKDKDLRGVLTGKKEGLGKNNSTLYELELPDGNKVEFWGSFQIDGKLKNTIVGEEIGVEYLGKEEIGKDDEGKPKFVKNFNVFRIPKPDIEDVITE